MIFSVSVSLCVCSFVCVAVCMGALERRRTHKNTPIFWKYLITVAKSLGATVKIIFYSESLQRSMNSLWVGLSAVALLGTSTNRLIT